MESKMIERSFRCPICGGANFGTAIIALRRDRQVVFSASMSPDDRRLRPGDEIAIIKYRCHSTADGADDITSGAPHIENGTHAIFLGAKGKPCGWDLTYEPRHFRDLPDQCFEDIR
jgi:hypothetical protein